MTKNIQTTTEDEGLSLADLEAFRASPPQAATSVAETVSYPVRDPEKTEFFRTHPGEDMKFPATTIPYRAPGDTTATVYLVMPQVRGVGDPHEDPVVLHLCVTRYGNQFLWPVKTGIAGNVMSMEWAEARAQLLHASMEGWVKKATARGGGGYEIIRPLGDLPDPVWPADLVFLDVVNKAFKGRIIRDANHPVIRDLLGA